MKVLKKYNPFNNDRNFKAFFDELFPVMTVFANRFVKDDDIAHDIAQDSFIAVWEKKPDIKTAEELRFYLYSVVRNRCINHLKHQKIKQTHFESALKEGDEYFYETNIIEQEVFIQLRSAIKELAPQTQEILNLSLQGYGNNEIAEEMEISVNTIKTLKRRAFKKLNKELREHFYMFFL